MRISGLLGAVIALSVLTPIPPANAITLSAGDLTFTDLFRWQGQYGTPTWREILANLGGAEGLTFYLWNVPTPPIPVVIPPAPVIDPLDPIDPFDPTGTSGGDAVGSTYSTVGSSVDLPWVGANGGVTFVVGEAVPETSTWAMLLLGCAGLAFAGYRQGKASFPARTQSNARSAERRASSLDRVSPSGSQGPTSGDPTSIAQARRG